MTPKGDNLILIFAVATSLAVLSVSYIGGSAPEWVILKASVALIALGTVGRIGSAILASGPRGEALVANDDEDDNAALPVPSPKNANESDTGSR